jgi:hypothetical protein
MRILKFLTWHKSRTPNGQERSLLRVLLRGPDERYTKLLRQVETAPYVQRALQQGERVYRLSVPSTREDLLIRLDEDLESSTLEVTDQSSRTVLAFKVVLLRGGFFGFLEGKRADGQKWSRNWILDRDSLQRAQRDSPFLVLPSLEEQAEAQERGLAFLSKWLDDAELVESRSSRLRFFRSATTSELEEFRRRENVKAPAPLLELWKVSDGVDLGDLELLGSKDARIWDGFRDAGSLLIIADLPEDGVIGVLPDEPEDSTVYLVEPGVARRQDAVALSGSLKDFLRESIRRTEIVK